MVKSSAALRAVFGICIYFSLGFSAHAGQEIVYVDMGGGCHIGIEDIYEGHFSSKMPLKAGYWTDTPPHKTDMENFGVPFECQILDGSTVDQVSMRFGAVPDKTADEGWSVYYESDEDRDNLHSLTKVYALKAVNASGFYMVQDDNDGDEATRQRYFSYCLFHDHSAVCGSRSVTRLQNPRGSILPEIVNILKSVRFVDN
ncbi:hypothetical protein HDG34_002661 [Paraburkholderia sp. HC6.4b]|uniref:hypothetical protein n=1 Tax=unclassified Paraburkholderia TaxID=2615204 RepID=UPI00161C9D95|nr:MULTISPECIES: hypothetical protein [unclassified Paraburkholderia]MBB5408724.1 hypothetical protein [Paraburkholderia sp. HC6.4b]MBB5450554.1 hypothetical protein [Paraburkholderia sp. Kb1A]